MADNDDAKRTWSRWLNHWLSIRNMTQAQLVEASSGDLNPKTVSKWVNAASAASSDFAVIVARILNAPVTEAMKAAGYPLTAEEIGKDAPEAPVDPGIRDILAADLLTDEEKARWIRVYQDDLAQARLRIREMTRAVEDARRSAS